MKPPLAALVPVLLALACPGCESAREVRIRQNAELFASLDPFSQKLIREGLFNLGFTAETVVMSLGKPDHVETRETPDGPVETWTYQNFLYASLSHMTLGPSDPGTTNRGGRQGSSRSAPQNAVPASRAPAAPTVGDLSAPPLATLRLELRDGKVIRAHIEP